MVCPVKNVCIIVVVVMMILSSTFLFSARIQHRDVKTKQLHGRVDLSESHPTKFIYYLPL